jgi:hypothetical protein
VDSGNRQSEPDVFAAVITWREWFVVDTGHLMPVSMNYIMDDIIDARVWNFLPRLECVAYICHFDFSLSREGEHSIVGRRREDVTNGTKDRD